MMCQPSASSTNLPPEYHNPAAGGPPPHYDGCVLGKCGDVIQQLWSKTGSRICVLPPEHLPICTTSTDELVQNVDTLVLWWKYFIFFSTRSGSPVLCAQVAIPRSESLKHVVSSDS